MAALTPSLHLFANLVRTALDIAPQHLEGLLYLITAGAVTGVHLRQAGLEVHCTTLVAAETVDELLTVTGRYTVNVLGPQQATAGRLGVGFVVDRCKPRQAPRRDRAELQPATA